MKTSRSMLRDARLNGVATIADRSQNRHSFSRHFQSEFVFVSYAGVAAITIYDMGRKREAIAIIPDAVLDRLIAERDRYRARHAGDA